MKDLESSPMTVTVERDAHAPDGHGAGSGHDQGEHS